MKRLDRHGHVVIVCEELIKRCGYFLHADSAELAELAGVGKEETNQCAEIR